MFNLLALAEPDSSSGEWIVCAALMLGLLFVLGVVVWLALSDVKDKNGFDD